MSVRGSKDHPASGSTKRQGDAGDDSQALLDTQPDWDRMGEIADRLLSTPPDRQAVGKALAPRRGKAGDAGARG
jgi:hypothetical protein